MSHQNELRPRRGINWRIDPRVIDAIAKLARRRNTSLNRLAETLLVAQLKAGDELPADFVPMGDRRTNNKTNSHED